MNLRILCIALLSCIGVTAHAEQYTYEVVGYFESRVDGTDPATHFPGSFRAGEYFHGWVVYDTNRVRSTEDGWVYPAPLRSLYLENSAGDSIISTENFSRLGAGGIPGFDTMGFSTETRAANDFIYSGGQAFRGGVGFSWASTETGQLPEEFVESADFYLPHLLERPRSWSISVTNTGQCSSNCDPARTSRLRGHVVTLGTDLINSRFEGFNSAPEGWTTSSGNWAAVDGSYTNEANVAFTSSVYTGVELNRRYYVDATLYSQWSAPGNTLGLLLHYLDSANYDEIRFSPTGVVTYSRIRNGNRNVLKTGQYPVIAPRTWFPVSVSRAEKWLSLRANDAPVFDVEIGDIRGGYSGLFSSWNRARFDGFNVRADHFFIPFVQDFQQSTEGWEPVSGQWAAIDGSYYSSSNVAAAISTYEQDVFEEYTISTSLQLDWSNHGNRGGLIYDYQDPSNYRAALVSVRTPQGLTGFSWLQVIEVRAGVRRVVEEQVFQVLRPREWSPLSVRRNDRLTVINVGDRAVLLNQSVVAGAKRVGLMTSFNKVRFDDVVVGVGY